MKPSHPMRELAKPILFTARNIGAEMIHSRLIRRYAQSDLDDARRYARHAAASKDDPNARAWWRLASVRALAAARRMLARMREP